VSAEKINPKDKSLLVNRPSDLSDIDALTYYDDTKDLKGFHKMMHDEPHMIRRKQILEKYPQVKELFKKDHSSIFYVLLILVLQIVMISIVTKYTNWFTYILCLYCVGATLSHSYFVLMHDLTHYTCFESKTLNQLMAILGNFAQGVPSAVAFGRYHRDHHTYLGIPTGDPDLPSTLEIKYFNTPFRKMVFILLMPFFYSIKPYFMMPKKPVPMEVVNFIAVFSWDYFIYCQFGIWGVVYLVVGTLVGLGITPVAAHIIAEHYEFVKGQETYSYYGPINWINFNMGYHVEHHDFPMIPWTKLPRLREIAPEFYNNLPQISSYLGVWKKYVFDDTMGAWSRIGRIPPDQNKKTN